MSRFRCVFSAVVAMVAGLVGLGATAPSAVAGVTPPYCDLLSTSGSVQYDTIVTAVPASNNFLMFIACSEPNGRRYTLTLSGSTAQDSCLGGHNLTGVGTVTGVGPRGAVTGTFTFARPAIHFTMNGSFTSGGRNHEFVMWLDLIDKTPAECGYDAARLIGHGVFFDVGVPPFSGAPAFMEIGAVGTVSPGLPSANPAPFSLTFSGSSAGVFNGVPGTCSVSFNGSGTGSAAAAVGSGVGHCGGTTAVGAPISISCNMTFRLTGAVMALGGTCTGTSAGALDGVLALQPTSVNPTASFSSFGQFTVA